MRIEMLPGMDNVIRFPVEERARPTLSLVREIAPDCREVFRVMESFGIEGPAYDLRHQVDRETAEHILNAVSAEPGEMRTAMLDAMLAPLVKTAVQACRAANEASHVMVAAQQRLQAAVTSGSLWSEQLRERGTSCAARRRSCWSRHTRAAKWPRAWPGRSGLRCATRRGRRTTRARWASGSPPAATCGDSGPRRSWHRAAFGQPCCPEPALVSCPTILRQCLSLNVCLWWKAEEQARSF
jgi:hypothetical protein